MAVRRGAAGAWVALGLALAGCGRGTGGSDSGDNASTSETAAVERYARSMSAGDPETCFAKTSFVGAQFDAGGGQTSLAPPTRVIIAIDASGSMAGRVGQQSKLALAQKAAAAFVDGLPPEVEAGLLVFGAAGDNSAAGKAASCRAVDQAVPITRDRQPLADAVARVRPVGWTPLAAALTRAETLLLADGKPGEQVIYVVSDGEETCGGDPVSVARAINSGRTKAIVNIIGFAVPDAEAAALRAVASAGGGAFVNSRTDAEMEATLARIRESNRQARNTIEQSNATARNNIAAANAGARTRICTSNLIARERIAVSNDIARKRIAGQPVTVEEQAERLMEQRHTALERRTEAYVTRLDASRDQVNGRIDRAADSVR